MRWAGGSGRGWHGQEAGWEVCALVRLVTKHWPIASSDEAVTVGFTKPLFQEQADSFGRAPEIIVRFPRQSHDMFTEAEYF